MDLNELKEQKYLVKEIESTNIWYYASQISNDEKYLAYGVDQIIKIYDLISNEITKTIQIDREITACQFSQDSQFLYIGSYQFIYCYDVSQKFEQILKLLIHQEFINNILPIQNKYLISCSDDRTIIKTDLQNQKELFKLIGHTNIIFAIEYDDINDIIISGSHDKSIKLWNCNDQSIIINQQFNEYVTQIQLINKGQHLLTLEEDGNLINWKIDLITKNLIIISQYKDQNNIFNFHQFNQGQNLILICKNCIKIMDNDYKIINQIVHTGEDSTYLYCKQHDNAKLIQIRSGSNYHIQIKRKDYDSYCIKLIQLNFQYNLINSSNNLE